ncbi:hypothetical protein [Xanthomonas cerealis]|uniref:hypothetical protein n=1 Tax=Xanthomonas cerealis TaxID=3390025 RepID=UPI001F22C34F|nr:hypothetical protein [Xanthomonas translucens]
MKLKTSFFSKSRIAPEPTATPAGNHAHGAAKADGAATVPQPLGRAPRSHSGGYAGRPKGLLSSMQKSLNSAQKSLLSLQRKMSQQQTATSPRPSREASGRANVADRRPTPTPAATAFAKQQRPAMQSPGNAPPRTTRPPAAAAPARPAPQVGPMRRPAHAQAMESMPSRATPTPTPTPTPHYGKHDALINMLYEERDPTPLEQHLLNELRVGTPLLNQHKPSPHYGKHDALINMLHEERDPTPLEQHLLNELRAGTPALNQHKPSPHYGKHDASINMLRERRDPAPLKQHLPNELKAELTVPKHRADQAQVRAETPVAQHADPERLIHTLNKQLAELSKADYAISTRLIDENRGPTPKEQALRDSRLALIMKRNQVRDSQLNEMLQKLEPLEEITPHRTTQSVSHIVQQDVMHSNARKLRAVQEQGLDSAKFTPQYADAKRRLQSLRDSGARPKDVQRLERMMQGYDNLVKLEKIVQDTDDQLERMGARRLMDSIPTTPEEREQMREKDYAEEDEANAQGYY